MADLWEIKLKKKTKKKPIWCALIFIEIFDSMLSKCWFSSHIESGSMRRSFIMFPSIIYGYFLYSFIHASVVHNEQTTAHVNNSYIFLEFKSNELCAHIFQYMYECVDVNKPPNLMTQTKQQMKISNRFCAIRNKTIITVGLRVE